MKNDMEYYMNLRSLVYGFELNKYQRALAINEFEKLMKRVEQLQESVKQLNKE